MDPNTLPIGYSDFRHLRRSAHGYVDKSVFVEKVLAAGALVTLICRPRRFGKTLNLSTLRYFLEKSDEDRTDLFADLSVWRNEAAMAHFGRHPVIFLSFKDVKASSWEGCCREIQRLLWRECSRFTELVGSDAMRTDEAQLLSLWRGLDTELRQYSEFLRLLTEWLQRVHGETVAVIIDEYDTPIHAGFVNGYYKEVVEFFRSFFGAGLKDNPFLFKAVLTGVLRIAKEGLFSTLNHIRVFGVTDHAYSADFGFTETEVAALRQAVGSPHSMEDLRAWYNGYHVGDSVVYNPWSIINCLASPDDPPQPYWVATGDPSTLDAYVFQGGAEALQDIEAWIHGETVRRKVSDTTFVRNPRPGADQIASLLLQAGYLTAVQVERTGSGLMADLRPPNHEVDLALKSVADEWLARLGGGEDITLDLVRAFMSGDAPLFETILGRVVEQALSYHDIPSSQIEAEKKEAPRDPERVFHAFVLGILVRLETTHLVRSNRESGYGRSDVLVIPRRPGLPGHVIEFKRVGRGERPATALKAALDQIRERDYAAELRDAGAEPIHEWAVAFSGKRVKVRLG